MSSIFTKILNWEIPSDIIYKQNDIFVIKDINPKAKLHLLIIPEKEISTINDLKKEDSNLIANMFFVAQKMAKKFWVEQGYKLGFNVWEKWWQEVMHIHMHLLSDL